MHPKSRELRIRPVGATYPCRGMDATRSLFRRKLVRRTARGGSAEPACLRRGYERTWGRVRAGRRRGIHLFDGYDTVRSGRTGRRQTVSVKSHDLAVTVMICLFSVIGTRTPSRLSTSLNFHVGTWSHRGVSGNCIYLPGVRVWNADFGRRMGQRSSFYYKNLTLHHFVVSSTSRQQVSGAHEW